MYKKGDIWISAVLYMALGIIVIALILAASLPLINKIKDRNTFSETKKLLLAVDDTIKIVSREGPGSQRELSPLTINKGQLFIDQQKDRIYWQLKTSAKIIEPGISIQEGVLNLTFNPTVVKDEYLMTISLDYSDDVDINLNSAYKSPFVGHYTALISHTGQYVNSPLGNTMPVVLITIS